eukprot:gene3582-3827_t
MSTGISEVKLITPKEFQSLLQSSERSNYQLVDVREENELQVAKFDGTDIINLPLSQIEQIGQEIKQGKLLDLNKPTICICRRGARAGRFANFLVSEAQFPNVINLQGGIEAYANEVDKSVGTY